MPLSAVDGAPKHQRRPGWAHGATILVPGIRPEDLEACGQSPENLRPWHVVVLLGSVAELRRGLRAALPARVRPRPQPSKERRILWSPELNLHLLSSPLTESSYHLREQRDGGGARETFACHAHTSPAARLTHSPMFVLCTSCTDLAEAARSRHVLPATLNGSSDVSSDFSASSLADFEVARPPKLLLDVVETQPQETHCGEEVWPEELEVSEITISEEPVTQEMPVVIDADTAAMIQQEQWATRVERNIRTEAVVVKNTFIEPLEILTPRTTLTAQTY